MATKIYTKTGDLGETSLFGGMRLSKADLRIDSYGTVDELNAHIGLIKDLIEDQGLKQLLKEIQDRLFTIGSNLASDPTKEMITPDVKPADLEMLEQQIDAMQGALPELKHFILPGGHPTVSSIHITRCVCRRTERLVVALAQVSKVDELIIRYLNRLSDYLFVLGRFVAQQLGVEEVRWTPRK
ncbi:MAG: cob(I)yrinic acid a,c-diamide adenosyltransferase [Phaeodactylibacter sp.]|nr:cob(I)yrinic acid a,c-diamide adenosyltransferase [Phaeodactylibacter sp.]